MKLFSRLALLAGKYAPRGGWRVVRFAAARDPVLWDYPLPLAGALEGYCLRADLRESVSMNFLRSGRIPGQISHDILFAKLVNDGDIVFDVGANIGYTALLFRRLVGSSGKVVALEPGSRIFESLRRNADPNGIVALQVAATDCDGQGEFHEASMSDLSSLEKVEGSRSVQVPLLRLDRLADQYGAPSFVKIDVEGHEPAVLRGMNELLASSKPPIVLFEALDKECLDRCISEILRSCKTKFTLGRLGNSGHIASDLESVGSNDYLFLPAWAESRLKKS